MRYNRSYVVGAMREFRIALIAGKTEMRIFCVIHGFNYNRFKIVTGKVLYGDPDMEKFLPAIVNFNKKILGA